MFCLFCLPLFQDKVISWEEFDGPKGESATAN